MSNKNSISLEKAQNQFLMLYETINKTDEKEFIHFVYEQFTCNKKKKFTENLNNVPSTTENHENRMEDPFTLLTIISDYIKKKLPLNGILPSENIIYPAIGENSDCLPDITVHIDQFLYNEDDVDNLVEDGKLKRNYCKDCGSKNIEPLIFISHSMSREEIYFIFNNSLPVLHEKTVLDIGSRLGAVLYGAYIFSKARRIIGVEMNKDLCDLQNDVIYKYKMENRVEILNKKIEEAADIVKMADVIIINNAFEFYTTLDEQIKIWEFLQSHIKQKTILVTNPHLQTVFQNMNISFDLNKWVKEFNYNSADQDSGEYEIFNDYSHIAFYEVL